ncbi:MAG TPA: hypothetical protein DCP31_00185 [Cyanobacteria bacterium UBA8543]|nr:hypothetical protein [Cyanobacteria bacterium UBA8543]
MLVTKLTPLVVGLFPWEVEMRQYTNRLLAKIAVDEQDAHPTKVIFACGVGVPPAQKFDERGKRKD